MTDCPVCDFKDVEGQMSCSFCGFPLQFDKEKFRDQIIPWAKLMWKQKTQHDKLFEEPKTPLSPKSPINLSEKQLSDLTTRVWNLEQSKEQNEELKTQIKDLSSELKKLTSKQESLLKMRGEVKELQDNSSKIQEIETKFKEDLLKQFQEERSQFEEKFQEQLNKWQTKLDEIEGYLKAKNQVSSSYSRKNLSSNQENSLINNQIPATMSKRELSWEENELVEQYNNKRETLLDSTEVSETEESITNRRLGSNSEIIFESKRRSNYWIVEKEGRLYLIPSNNLRINEYNLETVKSLFECRGYQPDNSDNFKLLQPAIVSAESGGQTWKLQEPGILQF